jgi:hypothetical protein
MKSILAFVLSTVLLFAPQAEAMTCFSVTTPNSPVTNTTTATSVVGTGVGTTTIDPAWMQPGRVISIHARGVYKCLALGPTLTVTVKLGSVTVATVATTTLLSAVTTPANFDDDLEVVFQTAGTSGTCLSQGEIAYTTTAGSRSFVDFPATTSTLDTTSSQTLTITAAWNSASASNSVQINILTVKPE